MIPNLIQQRRGLTTYEIKLTLFLECRTQYFAEFLGLLIVALGI